MEHTEWIVRTGDTVFAVTAAESAVFVKSIVKNGSERAVSAPISMPFGYEAGGDTVPFRWRFRGGEHLPDGFALLYGDEEAGCTYRMTWRGREDLPGPAECSGVLANGSPKTVRLVPGEIFSVTFAVREPTAWRFMKESGISEGLRWHNDPNVFFPGTGIYRDVLTSGQAVTAWTTTHQDFNSGGMIPMIYLDGGDMGAYTAFEWTSCRIRAAGAADGVRMSVDFGEGFATRLPVGEEFLIPPVYAGVYDGDTDDGSNEFKRWFFAVKTPACVRDNPDEPLVQADEQVHPELARQLGIQSVKWDYGWWGAEREKPDAIWKKYEGSWKLRAPAYINTIRSRGCGTMAEYGAYLKSLGLNWTVYVLLHDSRTPAEGDDQLTSVGENGHPEWFSDRCVGPSAVADLGNRECAEYCKRKLYEFFTENNVSTWRSDFEPIAHRSDKENRHEAGGTDVQYWCSRGFYDIVDYLTAEIPGFRYESCSSGGSMKDYATMHRAAVFNNDDSADHSSLRTTFYDSSYCFPPAQLQAPCNGDTFSPACEAHYNGEGDPHFGMRAMIMGGIMCSSWCGPKNGHYRYGLEEIYGEYCRLHNEKIKPLIREGNLYHTLPRPDHIHWDGMQYGWDRVPENGVGGVLFLFKPTDAEGSEKTVRIRGLNPDLVYTAAFYERKEQSFTATGAELMEKGLTCVIEEPAGSEMVFFMVQGKEISGEI